MNVPFLDLSHQNRPILSLFLKEVERISQENGFIGGSIVAEFEKRFADYCGIPHCVAVNSGTDALRLALLGCQVEPDSEVITAPFTFIATAEAITQSGCRLVFADVDPLTFTLDPGSASQMVTGRTRAIVPVHIFGLPADMDGLSRIAESHSLLILEDACQAHGATFDGRHAGTFSSAAAFSFYPSKNLGAFGDAGAVTCQSDALAERLRLLRNHGQRGPYCHDREGFNSRMDTIQAAALLLKLDRLTDWNRERAKIAAIYREELQSVSEVRFQKVPSGAGHVYHLVAAVAENRDALRNHLAARGIECRIIYPTPLHLSEAYRQLRYRRGDFPNAERICNNIICFPVFPGLPAGTVRRISEAVREFYGIR